MSAYVIVEIEVKDPAGYEEYKVAAEKTVKAFGGRYIVRGSPVETLEGDWKPKRLVVLEFPTLARAKEWYSSPEYRRALEIRLRTAEARMIAIEGI